jgi:hypothetical protein
MYAMRKGIRIRIRKKILQTLGSGTRDISLVQWWYVSEVWLLYIIPTGPYSGALCHTRGSDLPLLRPHFPLPSPLRRPHDRRPQEFQKVDLNQLFSI